MKHRSGPKSLAGSRIVGVGSLVLLILALAPSAQAHTGSALLWTSAFQLLFGNSLIAILEGLVISRLFGVRRMRAIGIMVPANYFSCWVSLALFHASGHGIRGDIGGFAPYAHMWPVIGLMVSGSFLLSLILEWPFCFWILAGQLERLKRSGLASLAAQTASYLCLVPFFTFASYFGLNNISIDESLGFAPAQGIWIYYLAPVSGDVYRIRPNRSAEEKVASLGETDPRACLFAVPEGKAPPWASLWVLQKGFGGTARSVIGKLPGSRFGPLATEHEGVSKAPYLHRIFLDFSHTADLRTQPASHWIVAVTVRGVMYAAKTSLTRSASFGFPGVNFVTRSAILLPGDLVVFQWGDNIMLLDLGTGKMGRVTPGRSPVVVIE